MRNRGGSRTQYFALSSGHREFNHPDMPSYSRREFTKLALAALPGAALWSQTNPLFAADVSAKPNSKVRGVQIGLNVPYSFGNPLMSGDDILKNCLQLGLSGVELRTQPVEAFLGAPSAGTSPRNAVVKGAAAANADTMKKWRASAPVEKATEFRTRYEQAGVLIEVLKVDGLFKMSDEELDYAFTLAKTLGARAISSEISKVDNELKRLGKFADKHRLMVGYHGHAATTAAHWENAFSFARYNGANVDLGHFVAGNNESPVAFIKKHHDRITHVHVKDRKRDNGGNTPFGEGDTPIAEVLQLIRDKKWRIQATIEFEYRVPAGSDRMTEIARAIKFCKDARA